MASAIMTDRNRQSHQVSRNKGGKMCWIPYERSCTFYTRGHVGVSNQRLTASRLFRGFAAVVPPAVSALFAPFNATYVKHRRRRDVPPS
ncbi:unnamed protein product [Lasius platythorax]|uniref:Uncharacterized protein n=1 Tax=Lasius platythorax TaxID=488582 RepID=A0AAV2NW11_9HYME